jgi:hypothetical protein
LQDSFSLQDTAPGSEQQQQRLKHGMHNSTSHQRDELDEELEPPQDAQQQQMPAAALGAALGSRLWQQAQHQLLGLTTWFYVQCSSGVLPVLLLSSLVLAGFCGMVILQGSALRTQQNTIVEQQQHVAEQQTALAALQEQLQQAQQQLRALPDMQQLQDDASSCKAGLDGLGSSHNSLQGTLDSLFALAGQLKSNMSSLSQASALGEKAWQLLEAAAPAGSTAEAGGAAAAAAVAAPALLQQTQQQQALAEQLQQSMVVLDTLPATIKQEVKQQINAVLPPVDLALADCGARIVFHTPLNTTVAAATSASAAPASGAMQWLQQQVAHRLLPGHAAASRQQQRHMLSAAQINNIILRPHSGFPARAALAGTGAAATAAPSQGSVVCLPLQLTSANGSATAAALEIALPQPAAIRSVTFHHVLTGQQQQGSYDAAPGALHVAFANSSSCPAGICSAVGHAAVANISSTDAPEDAAPGDKQSVLAPGVTGVQQEVRLHPESFAAGRAVVKVQQAAAAPAAADDSSSSAAAGDVAGVAADRLVVHVSSSIGGGKELCMQRISVQGVPLDPAVFC